MAEQLALPEEMPFGEDYQIKICPHQHIDIPSRSSSIGLSVELASEQSRPMCAIAGPSSDISGKLISADRVEVALAATNSSRNLFVVVSRPDFGTSVTGEREGKPG